MIEQTATRAAVYCRISDDPAGTMLGVERQREDCIALAARRGWPVAEVYVDNDLSAYSGKVRPEYARLLDDVRAGRVDAIVAWHPDRLHRSPRELEDFITVVESAGIPVETVTAGTTDLSTPTGRAVARTVGAWARFESEHKAERVRRKLRELADGGHHMSGGMRAFGMTPDWSAVVPEEAAALREAADRILAGGTLRGVVMDWNRQGSRTPTGKLWSTVALRRILTSTRLAGWRTYHDDPFYSEGTWPAILDRPTVERLRTLLLDPSRRRNVLARSYLLAGIVTCGLCGNTLHSRPRAGQPRYVCAQDYGGCGHTFIAAPPLEALVSEMALQRLDSPALEAAIAERGAQSERAGEAEQLRRDEEALVELARDYYVERRIGRAEWTAAREALEARVEQARHRLAAETGTRALVGLTAGSARAAWPSLPFDRRRAVLLELLEAVRIASGRPGTNRFDPARVEPVWRV
jgi:DNA invertase Pin-like site-specific DNA recombinase